jgi:glycosyltransferase involved in cell wall biosynthesis
MGPGDQIDVISTMPNRYFSFNADGAESKSNELDGNVSITRIKLPKHKSGFIDQIFSFFVYYRETLKIVKKRQYNLVFASSSRLFTAFLGAKISRQRKIPLYLDIRDIFIENIEEIISNKVFKYIGIPILRFIERYTFRSARHINLVSFGFKDYFASTYKASLSFFTNGIDEEFIGEFPEVSTGKTDKSKLVITYAGNIGEGQGLHVIIPEAAKKLAPQYYFIIIGDGGARGKLEKRLEEMKIENVEVLPPISRDKLIAQYQKSDFLFLHLNNYKAFEKVLPSKLFEYGATGKYIIAGVGGYPRRFIKDNLPDALIFNPGNVTEFCEKLQNYHFNKISRQSFLEKYSRTTIMKEMAESVIRVL